MNVRVVRFTGVTQERMDALVARIGGAGGPPEGVTSTGIKVLYDADQQTAVVLQEFATAADLEEGARVLGAMDPGETPGTRASVDACEQLLELSA